jgi:iron complex outermembrane receptor protein
MKSFFHYTLASFFTTVALFATDQTIIDELQQEMSDSANIATQTNQNIDYQPFILSVLNGKELSKLGVKTLGEALTLVPGVDMATNTMNNRTPIFRGSNPLAYGQSTLVVDGYVVNDHFFSNYNAFLDFPIELIKRIEVVRGSGSFIEGVNGYAGTINVVTYAASQKEGGTVFSHVGSDQANRLGVWSRYKGENWTLAADAFTQSHDLHTPITVTDSLGFSAKADLSMAQQGAGFTLRYDKLEINGRVNDYKSGSAFGNLNVLPNPDGELQQPSWYLQAKYTLPVAKDTKLIFNTSVGQDSWKSDSLALPEGTCYNPTTGAVALCSALSNTTGYIAYPDGYTAALMLEGRRATGGMALHYDGFDAHRISTGITLSWDETIDMYTIGNKIPSLGIQDYTDTLPFFNANAAKRQSTEMYLSDSITFSDTFATAITAGLIQTSDMQQHQYGRIAAVYQPTYKDIFKVMLSEGVRYPSFQEMYVTKSAYAEGNPDVEPEHVFSAETQYIRKIDADLSAGVNLFYLKNEEQISRDNSGKFQNRGTNTLRGLEAELNGRLTPEDTLGLSYSYVQGQMTTDDGLSHDLAFTASHLIKAAWTHDFAHAYSLGFIVNYVGSKERQAIDTRDALEDITTVDLAAGWNMNAKEGWYVQGVIKNVTDTVVRYPTAAFYDKTAVPNLVIPYEEDYPVAERTFWLRAGWRF